MSFPYDDMHDIQNDNGWIIDTSVAVCLQIAGWTEAFLASPATLPNRPELRVAPSAYGHGEERNEFAEQLDLNNLQFWETMADAHPHITSAPFSGDARQAVQHIIRASRTPHALCRIHIKLGFKKFTNRNVWMQQHLFDVLVTQSIRRRPPCPLPPMA